jgi:hypothetical protein
MDGILSLETTQVAGSDCQLKLRADYPNRPVM